MRITAFQERFIRWVLRARTPEAAPILLTRHRIHVLPTRAGLGYAASLVVMLLGAMNYNLSLGHALTFLLAGLGVVTILHTFRNLVCLTLAPGRSEPVFAGGQACFTLRLDNPRRDPRRQLHLRTADGPTVIVDIDGNASATAQLVVPAIERGWLPLPRLTLATTWPLGLVRAWAWAAPAARCLVYPRPAAPGASPPPLAGHAFHADATTPTGSEDFFALRGHQVTDPPRHVAWKTAARLGADAPLMTKQYADPATGVLWLDWNSLPATLTIEERLSRLTRQVLDAHAAGVAWGLRLPGDELAPAAGEIHFHSCLRRLALHGKA